MRRECISCSCGHRGYTQKFLCASAWSTGKYTWGDGGSRIELLAVRHMPTLPEQSSYPTSRPQKGSVCLRLGWTWRSTVPSCWWSGRYIVLWKEHNESQSHRRIHSGFSHSSCLKFKRAQTATFNAVFSVPAGSDTSAATAESSVFLCIHSAEVNHHRNDATTTAGAESRRN